MVKIMCSSQLRSLDFAISNFKKSTRMVTEAGGLTQKLGGKIHSGFTEIGSSYSTQQWLPPQKSNK